MQACVRDRVARLRARVARRARDERGFTLTELIISITVMGIIVVPLGMATTTFIHTSSQAVPVYGSNMNARLLSTFFRADAQAAETIDTGAPCGSPTSSVVNMSWTDTTARFTVASYVIENISGSTDRRLVRRLCTDGSLVVTSRVVDTLGPTNVPVLTCDPDCAAPDTVTLEVVDGNGYRYELEADARVNAP